MFSDAESKETFAAVVRARLSGDTGYIPMAAYPQYFHPRVSVQSGDVACDAGGGNGQIDVEMTSVLFARAVGARGKVFCFEPVAENCAGLQPHTAAHPNITLECRGLWSGRETKPMLSWGGASRIDRWGVQETQDCSFIDLDSYLAAKHTRCDFLKMDVEGAELEALKGAEKTLRKYRPKLAISVYHSPLSDFLNIPKFISGLELNYEFFLGHHFPYWYETILYCKPRRRA
jgi:FkbM family methyltransferase